MAILDILLGDAGTVQAAESTVSDDAMIVVELSVRAKHYTTHYETDDKIFPVKRRKGNLESTRELDTVILRLSGAEYKALKAALDGKGIVYKGERHRVSTDMRILNRRVHAYMRMYSAYYSVRPVMISGWHVSSGTDSEIEELNQRAAERCVENRDGL